MSRTMDPTEARRLERQAAKKAALDQKLLRDDVQLLMRNPAMRRVLNRFFGFAGLDQSPFNPNAMTQSYAIGKREGAEWWVDLIRDHAPEQEVVMRDEARRALLADAADEDEGDDD